MIAERREAMRQEMRQKEQDSVVKAGMAKIFGFDVEGGDERDSWSRTSSARSSDEDVVRPVRVQPKPRGFWSWDQGRPQVQTQFPPCLPSDPNERLHTPELSHPDYSSERDTTRTPDPFAGKPKAVPASPPRSNRPTVWRQWSLDRQQERPRTREVLWPHEGKPYHRPPKLRHRHYRSASADGDEPGVSEHSVYTDEHIGFKSLDQGQWILAQKDAQRQTALRDAEAKQRQMRAARNAEKKGQFFTVAVKTAVSEPEMFSLRMVRGANRRREDQKAQRAARRAQKEELQHTRRTEEAVRRYERERREAIATTMSLPNLGRPYAAWRRFVRLLRVAKQSAALSELRTRAYSIVSASTAEYDEAMAAMRQTASAAAAVPAARQSDFAAALQNERNVESMLRPLSAGPPLPSLDGDGAAKNDDADEPYTVEDAVQSKLAQYDAFSAAVFHGGERLPVLPGAKAADKVRHGFADACRRQNLAPVPVMPAPYLFGPAEAGIVDLRNKMIGSKLAVAVFKGLAALSADCRVSAINMAGNGLTEHAMYALSPLLQIKHVVNTLVQLDLSHNPLGVKGSKGLAAAIAGNSFLVELQIADCKVGDKGAIELMRSIGECAGLRILNISRNGLSKVGALEVSEMLVRTLALEDLDVSWNCLAAAGCKRIIGALSENRTLLKLNLEWNSAADAVNYLEEVLQDGVLQEIDLSNNDIGEREAQVIAGLLKKSKTLKKVDLGGNPIGVRGGSTLFKALLVLEAHGVEVDLTKCNLGSFDESLKLFDPANPNGEYDLDLAEPYDEMVAHELVELAWLEEGENWQDEKMNGTPYNLQEPEDLGIQFGRTDRLVDYFELPEEGRLTLKYASTRRRPKMTDAATPTQIAMFKNLMKESAMAAELALKAACSVCYLTVAQAESLVEEVNLHAGDRVDAVIFMLPRIIDVDKVPLLLNVLSDAELQTLAGRVGVDFFHFNSKNPSGRYKLDLSDEFDHLVAQALIDYTNDEIMFAQKNKLPDVSQDGGYCGCWRNCLYQPMDAAEPSAFIYSMDWKLPTVEEGGILQLDFSSTNRPSSKARPAADTLLQNLLTDMASAFNRVALPTKPPRYETPGAAPGKGKKKGKKKGDSETLPATADSAVPDASKKEVQSAKRRVRRISATHGYFKKPTAGGDGSDTTPSPHALAAAEAAAEHEHAQASVEATGADAHPATSAPIPAGSGTTGTETDAAAAAAAVVGAGWTGEAETDGLVVPLGGEYEPPMPSPGGSVVAPLFLDSAMQAQGSSEFAEGGNTSAVSHLSEVTDTSEDEIPLPQTSPTSDVGKQRDTREAPPAVPPEIQAQVGATSAKSGRSSPLATPPAIESTAEQSEAASQTNYWRQASVAAKADRDVNLLGGAQANRGVMVIKGGRNNRRPPWAIPLREKYPVENEAERRRVGTMLATQILRRSTFSCYFSIEQVLKIISWFPRQHRVEPCVAIYARCIEFERFVEVKSLLTADEIQELTHRLGALCLMNPYNPDGPYVLELSLYDERKVALMLVWLAEGEPGENWQEESFEGRDFDITKQWLTDEGMPPKGVMRLRYVTNPGCAIAPLRSKLAAQTLIGPNRQYLIPSDRLRPPTPEHLKSKFAKPKVEKEFGTVSPSAGKRNLSRPSFSRGGQSEASSSSRPNTSQSKRGGESL